MAYKKCACNKQIVWFFDGVPTVVVCETCEITFHCDVKVCPNCNNKVAEYIRKEG